MAEEMPVFFTVRQCVVCEGGEAQQDGTVFICSECVRTDRVRTYCPHCVERLDMSYEEAQQLMLAGGIARAKIPKGPGFVIRYTERCPGCGSGEDGEEYPSRVFLVGKAEIN